MQIALRVLILLLAAAAIAAASNTLGPRRIPWTYVSPTDPKGPNAPAKLTLDDVRKMHAGYAVVFIDARKPEQYAQGHLARSLNLPSTQKEMYMNAIWQNVPPDQDIVIYCDGGTCEASENVYEFLGAQGFKKLRIFTDGWEAIAPSELEKEYGEMRVPGAPGMESGMPQEGASGS